MDLAEHEIRKQYTQLDDQKINCVGLPSAKYKSLKNSANTVFAISNLWILVICTNLLIHAYTLYEILPMVLMERNITAL